MKEKGFGDGFWGGRSARAGIPSIACLEGRSAVSSVFELEPGSLIPVCVDHDHDHERQQCRPLSIDSDFAIS